MRFLTSLRQTADSETRLACVLKIKTKATLLFLSLIAVACGLASAETKPSASHMASPAEKRLDGIPRPTDKDHNPLEPFHIARSPAEKALGEIIRRADKDKNIFAYVLGRPWYDAKKDTGYSRLFTKEFLRAASKMESDMLKESCGGKYLEGELCGIDYSPITCAQDYSKSGYLHRTVEDDNHKAKILSLGVDFIPDEIKTTYKLIKEGDDWKLDGVICGGGGGFNVDCSNSVCAEDVPYFHQKAEQGDADAQFYLGVMYNLGRGVKWNHANAARWFHNAAEQGHVQAQSYLGYIYEYGQGVRQDYAKAAKWFRKAAEQGHVQAQYFLGPIYENGRGVTQDYAEAAKWFRKAADLGDANSQYQLGMMYDAGRGVMQDHAEAINWLHKAAERGHTEARWELNKREIEKSDRR